VLPSRTIQADLDNADIRALPRPPAVLVETSPGRHQAYWILDGEPLEPELHEVLSRKLTYGIPLCDHSGWPLGRKVRIPGTFNHKYLEGPKPVKVVSTSENRYSPEEFELLPEVPQHISDAKHEEFITEPLSVDDHPLEILERVRER